MRNVLSISQLISWVLGVTVLVIGVANLVLVHAVPGIFFLLLSVLYTRQANSFFREKLGFRIPLAVKIVLGIMVIWFTLGVSDLGDIID